MFPVHMSTSHLFLGLYCNKTTQLTTDSPLQINTGAFMIPNKFVNLSYSVHGTIYLILNVYPDQFKL